MIKRRSSDRNWYIGIILLIIGLVVLYIDVLGYSRTGKWTSLSFIVGIKMLLAFLVGPNRQFGWIQNPTYFVWLFTTLSWLPTAPTMIVLGLVGISIPSRA
jgi:phosphatidylglycerophosphate synthase